MFYKLSANLCFHKLYANLLKANAFEPNVRFLAKTVSGKRVGLIGAPFSKGQPKRGTEMGPQVLRNGGLSQHLVRLGYDVKDYGDLDFSLSARTAAHSGREAEVKTEAEAEHQGNGAQSVLKNAESVAFAAQTISEAVTTCLGEKRLPVTLGGDHSLGMGTIYGHAQVEPDLCVIWIDSHADINTALTSNSGNMHGMPVSFLLKEIPLKYSTSNGLRRGFGGIKPCISAANFAYIGLRDVDNAEAKMLKELQPAITSFSTQDIDKLGIYEVINRTLDRINPHLNRPIHVSFDIDAIDEYFAPSTGTEVPGGLTLREAFCIGEQVAKTKLLTGLDMVEVNPLLGSPADVRRTVNCASNIILSFLGKERAVYARSSSQAFTQH